jgi:hypothetical protein
MREWKKIHGKIMGKDYRGNHRETPGKITGKRRGILVRAEGIEPILSI